MSKIITVALLLICVHSFSAGPILLLPPKFTQSYLLVDNIDDANITINGKLWFQQDFQPKISAFRMDFDNSDLCDQIAPSSQNCKILIIGNVTYAFSPQKSLCQSQPTFIEIKRNLFQFFTYMGTRQVNNVKYNLWDSRYQGTGDVQYFNFLSDMSDQLKPKRLAFIPNTEQHMLSINAYINSYSQNFNSSSIFHIPAYCGNKTSQRSGKLRYDKDLRKNNGFLSRILDIIFR